jgi:galactose-1-phosphate uridylyltransferase
MKVTVEVEVTPRDAKKAVNVWLLQRLGQMLQADEPKLLIDEDRVFWHVPIVVATPDHAPVGPIGTLQVDAIEGTVVASSADLEQLRNAAELILLKLYPAMREWAGQLKAGD